jgi:hypothetical protein
MKRKHLHCLVLYLLIFMPCSSLTASPYENLATALREQTILQDLRAHCHINNSVSDEVMKKQFLANTESHDAITNAASALKKNDKTLYHEKIAGVPCPAGMMEK